MYTVPITTMIMSSTAAVQNASSEVEIRSPSAESIALYRVFTQLRIMARATKSCWQVAVISPVRRPGDTVERRTSRCRPLLRVMHSVLIRRLPPRRRSRYRSIHRLSMQTALVEPFGGPTEMVVGVVATEVKIEPLWVWPAEADAQQSSSDITDPPLYSSMPDFGPHVEYAPVRVSIDTS